MMKNLKKLLPLFAVLLGISLVFTQSAFKNAKTDNTLQAERWFIYTDSDHPIDENDAKEPLNYTMLDEEDTVPCDGESDLCAIRATVINGNQPDISGDLETAIENYFETPSTIDPVYIAEKN